MTTVSDESLDAVPDELLAAMPENIRDGLRGELLALTERLGERWHGGPWHPSDDGYREARQSHRSAHLNQMGDRCHQDLKASLEGWSADLESKPVLLLMFLWLECWALWDARLIYRTLRVVEAVVGEIVAPGTSEPRHDWEQAAWQVAGSAFSLITADADIFQQIVLSNPVEVATRAQRGVDTTAAVIAEIRSLFDQPGAESAPLAARGLRYIESVALQSQSFYEFLADAARALDDFHNWLATAPRVGSDSASPLAPEPHAGRQELYAQAQHDLLESIDDALARFRSGRERLSDVTLSRAEPWEKLLSEIREVATRESDAAIVFVPRRVSIRYCYPFAVQTDKHSSNVKDSWLDEARRDGRIGKGLAEPFKALGMKVQDVRPLDPTAFFAARGSDSGLYGGVHVELPSITLSSGQRDEPPSRCRVWIALSRMGNHCLCVEREELETPLPHVVYQAVAAGTLYAFGMTTAIGDDPREVNAWDNLHSFGRDVIHAVASADFWRSDQEAVSPGADLAEVSLDGDHYVRGNLHELLVIRTDAALTTDPDGIAAKLNSALGGRILLKPVQSTPTICDEWVRYPPVTRLRADGDTSGITGLAELGLAGDWCAYTGETTVFGIVAAPSWHSDVYTEAAQFASSWSPPLRLWSGRLQSAIEIGEGEENERLANELREIERTVRRHLAQIQGEELCATITHRRFLDRLLDMSGVPRLQEVLESQLLAAERMMDWWGEDARHKSEERRRKSDDARRKSEEQQRKSDQRRDQLLGVIALFGMFELGGFLDLANATGWHENVFGLFTVREGVWEDWLVASLFVVALLVLAAFYFDFSGLNGWLRRKRPDEEARS